MAPRSAPPAPTAASAAASSRRRRPTARVAIAGDPDHPANFGRLCSKGSALGETRRPRGPPAAPRDRRPRRPAGTRRSTSSPRSSARRSPTTARTAVAFYVSGQLLTEDYYVANKLMKGFIGSANIDTNSRLCMASAVAGHKPAFGADLVPGSYEDLELADLVVLVGSNLAWCHPVLFRRIAAARAARPALRSCVIDPRRTDTAEVADLHLPLAPQTATCALFNGLLADLIRSGAVDRRLHRRPRRRLRRGPGRRSATGDRRAAPPPHCGLTPADLPRFYDLFAAAPTHASPCSARASTSRPQGTDKGNAIINCHLATGRIGKPGAGPFSITGQPNAMGGREVGGLANMLAAHMDFDDPAHRAACALLGRAAHRRTARASRPSTCSSAVARRTDQGALDHGHQPGGQPARRRRACARRSRPARSSSSPTACADTDTARLRHVQLPAAGLGREGRHGHQLRAPHLAPARRSCRRRARRGPTGGSSPRSAGAWAGPRPSTGSGPADDLPRARRALARADGTGRDFDLGALAGLDDAAYERWSRCSGRSAAPPLLRGRPLLHARRPARMVPRRRRRRAVARRAAAPQHRPRPRPVAHDDPHRPRAAPLPAHRRALRRDPPRRRRRPRHRPGRSRRVDRQAAARRAPRPRHRPRRARARVFAPMHWTGETASAGRIGALAPRRHRPALGPAGAQGRAVESPLCAPRWHGFAVSRARPGPDAAYWARARSPSAGGSSSPGPPSPRLGGLGARAFGAPRAELVASGRPRPRPPPHRADRGRRRRRRSLHRPRAGRARARHLAAAFGEADDAALLAGRPGARCRPRPIVCACFDVGINTIVDAIATGRPPPSRRSARSLNAGTNCGSCRPGIAALLTRIPPSVAAE